VTTTHYVTSWHVGFQQIRNISSRRLWYSPISDLALEASGDDTVDRTGAE
jgi:hypothetical protein